MTEEQAEVKRVYTKAWRYMLREFLNWPEAKIMEWLRQWDEHFENPDALINHETAEWYITPLLIPEHLRKQLGHNVFRAQLESAIMAGPLGVPDYVDNYDWPAARERVEQVLAIHGASLPRL